MASQYVFGCWEWDGEANCISNSVTGERLRFAGEDQSRTSPWQGRSYLLRYEAEDFHCNIVVAVFQELRPASGSGVFWRSMRSRVQLVNLYQVDFARTAQISGYGEPPFGVWQRLIEFVPEAILFWPHAWPGLEDPANGPGRRDAARCVRALGIWANGCWRPEPCIEFVIETKFELDPTAPCHVMDKQYWNLADLSAVPAPPFVFVDERTPEEAANDHSPWPDPEDIKGWLVARGFADTPPEQTQIQVTAGLFDKAPHCRSDNGERYFFFDEGPKVIGGHSSPIGPGFSLISGDVWFPGGFSNIAVEWDGAATRDKNPERLHGSADRTGGLRLVRTDEWSRYHYLLPSCDDAGPRNGTSLTQEGRRLVWQNMLDAFASWKPTQGIHPAIRVRDKWERERDPGPLYVRWPMNDIEMLPFSWVEMIPPTRLAGVDKQNAPPQKQAIRWNASRSYVRFDRSD